MNLSRLKTNRNIRLAMIQKFLNIADKSFDELLNKENPDKSQVIKYISMIITILSIIEKIAKHL